MKMFSEYDIKSTAIKWWIRPLLWFLHTHRIYVNDNHDTLICYKQLWGRVYVTECENAISPKFNTKKYDTVRLQKPAIRRQAEANTCPKKKEGEGGEAGSSAQRG